MPCRCCSAVKPCDGFKPDAKDDAINSHLRQAAKLIREKYRDPLYDEVSWIEEWVKAFDHHLRGCPEKDHNI